MFEPLGGDVLKDRDTLDVSVYVPGNWRTPSTYTFNWSAPGTYVGVVYVIPEPLAE